MPRRLREKSHLPADGWSNWVKAMVPDDEVMNYRSFEARSRASGQRGMKRRNIVDSFPPGLMDLCGIYEWKAVGTFHGQRDAVVYVGSTCTAKPGALRARILQYCNNGSHKEDLINEALDKGYELWVRVKTSGPSSKSNKVAAEEMENELLETHNYAWNDRNNGAIRHILN